MSYSVRPKIEKGLSLITFKNANGRSVKASIGQQGNYKWLEMAYPSVWDLLKVAPQIVTDKYVSITRDANSVELSSEEIKQGWRNHGPMDELVISPLIAAVNQLPHNPWEEWYVFAEPTEIKDYEVFVSQNGFSLIADTSAWVIQALEKFWSQIERVGPESYLADTDYLIWVTTDFLLFEQVCQSWGIKA